MRTTWLDKKVVFRRDVKVARRERERCARRGIRQEVEECVFFVGWGELSCGKIYTRISLDIVLLIVLVFGDVTNLRIVSLVQTPPLTPVPPNPPPVNIDAIYPAGEHPSGLWHERASRRRRYRSRA